MSIEGVGQLIGLAIAALALVQGIQGVYAFVRRRDDDLLHWAGEVISLLASMERVFVSDVNSNQVREMALDYSIKAGELLDKGRLFFSNVPAKGTERGYRPILLDHIVRSSYVMVAVSAGRARDLNEMRLHVWECRRKFVEDIQRELGWSITRSAKDRTGASIPHDPSNWPPVNRRGWWE